MENNVKTLGILGGGQLGRMSALAAARLGISVVIFTPEEGSPASHVARETIVAAYDDWAALKDFSDKVDVISYEFENIPVETVDYLKTLKAVYPDTRLLEVSQDRILEKSFLNGIGVETTRWAPVKTPENLLKILSEWGVDQCILKTTRFGYDGKGQALYSVGSDANETFRSLNSSHLIMEELVDFSCEISVIVARDQNAHMITYGPMYNEHKDHILEKTTIPAPLSDDVISQSISLARKIAQEVDLVGVLTVEFFVTKAGGLLANEIAPRTHNSGHWTIDACAHSQFDQHVRAVCGLPVVDPVRHSDAVMLNLIGDDIKRGYEYLSKPEACVHFYGKDETRKGRKMGHVTLLKPKT